jgi:hypothetical protein
VSGTAGTFIACSTNIRYVSIDKKKEKILEINYVPNVWMG